MEPKQEPIANGVGDNAPEAANSEDAAPPDNAADEDYKPSDSQDTSEATTGDQHGAATRKSSRAWLIPEALHCTLGLYVQVTSTPTVASVHEAAVRTPMNQNAQQHKFRHALCIPGVGTPTTQPLTEPRCIGKQPPGGVGNGRH